MKREEYFTQIFKHSDKNFVTFLRQFLEKLVKNYPKKMKLFKENFEIIWRNYVSAGYSYSVVAYSTSMF